MRCAPGSPSLGDTALTGHAGLVHSARRHSHVDVLEADELVGRQCGPLAGGGRQQGRRPGQGRLDGLRIWPAEIRRRVLLARITVRSRPATNRRLGGRRAQLGRPPARCLPVAVSRSCAGSTISASHVESAGPVPYQHFSSLCIGTRLDRTRHGWHATATASDSWAWGELAQSGAVKRSLFAGCLSKSATWRSRTMSMTRGRTAAASPAHMYYSMFTAAMRGRIAGRTHAFVQHDYRQRRACVAVRV